MEPETIVFYKTETTGFPNFKARSNNERQPHLVKIIAVKCNAETQEILETFEHVVYPENWIIPQITTDVHGITQDMALETGKIESEVITKFISFCGDSQRVCWNKNFHGRIIRIALKRYLSEVSVDKWAEKDGHICASIMSKPFVQIPLKSGKGFRNPSLKEACLFFAGEDLQKHSYPTSYEVLVCKEFYFKMIALSKAD